MAASADGALPFQSDGLAVVQPGRDLHVDRPSSRQLHALVRALGRFRQRDGQRGCDVLAGTAEILLLELETTRPRRATERLLKISSKPPNPPPARPRAR